MFGSTVIEVGMGLAFIYFLIAVICANINDLISRWLNWRAQALEAGIRTLLGDPELVNKVWHHPLLRGVAGKPGRAPAHIAPNTFALALFDAIVPSANRPSGLDAIRLTATRLPESAGRHMVVNAIDAANKNIALAHKSIEDWFNNAMEQVSQEYKRKMIYLSLGIAALVTMILGVDSIEIANTLYREPAVRAAVTNAAQSTAGFAAPAQNVTATLASLDALELPLGWNTLPATPGAWGKKIVGLMLTALAASLGSPFWYDVLRNLTLLRRDK